MYPGKKTVVAATALALSLFCGTAWATAKRESRKDTKTTEISKAMPQARQSAIQFGKAESLSGTVSAVDTAGHMVILTSAENVPFDLKVTPKTVIEVAGKRTKLDMLTAEIAKQASVKFVPTSNGDFASNIEVSQG